MALQQKAFSDIITFSRASNATRVGPDGTVQYAPHNLFTYSEQFDNAAWAKSEMTVTANSVAAPNGTVTADKIISSTVNTYHQVSSNVTTVANVVYALSVYLKMGESRYANLLVNNNGGFSAIGVDMQTGTIVTNSVAVAQASGSIQSVGNGWYRQTLFVQAASTGIDFRVTASNSANTSWTFAGDGSSGFYVWGAQASRGSIAGDYTPTTSAAVYGPRFDYDPVTLAANGLLIEEQRANICLYSEDLTNAVWTKSQSTIVANTVTAPDGTLTADLMQENTAAATHQIYQSMVASAVPYTLSVCLKAAGRNWAFIRFDDASIARYAFFNLSTGTVGTVDGVYSAASITPVGNGWYRCSVTVTATVATWYTLIASSTGNNVTSYTGDGSSGIYVWGTQVEAGAFATSYIPTVASTVTRSADVASVNTLSPWYNGTEGTILTQARSIADGAKGIYVGVEISNGSFDKRLIHGVTGSVYRTYYQAPITSFNSSVTTTASSDIKIATGFNSAGLAMSVNGNTTVTNATAWTDSNAVTVLNIANIFGGSYGNCWVKRIAFYPRKLTNAELQTLTA